MRGHRRSGIDSEPGSARPRRLGPHEAAPRERAAGGPGPVRNGISMPAPAAAARRLCATAPPLGRGAARNPGRKPPAAKAAALTAVRQLVLAHGGECWLRRARRRPRAQVHMREREDRAQPGRARSAVPPPRSAGVLSAVWPRPGPAGNEPGSSCPSTAPRRRAAAFVQRRRPLGRVGTCIYFCISKDIIDSMKLLCVCRLNKQRLHISR